MITGNYYFLFIYWYFKKSVAAWFMLHIMIYDQLDFFLMAHKSNKKNQYIVYSVKNSDCDSHKSHFLFKIYNNVFLILF
jgi:hypothetical protein